MPTSPSIDRETLTTLFDSLGGDPDFLAELLDEYFKDAPAQFQTLHEALITGNAETFRRAAHSMKSNSANFGAMTLSGMCKELEEMGRTGQLDGAAPLIVQAETEYQRGKSALEDALKEV